ncbi:restriction endonuclease subunit S [Streptomyces antimycoticus]|uniref:restriction endonuclease subunit S n=1 Tax=Streptomyces antimycoticus TaxID=68175 RepID=UPI00256FC4C8|nr:restriction endonuclease subunit S [Streptomyces antimycoticus]WJD97194.1 restriction endonuclease subunit S [Streptomyces antimycoticus]
MSNYKLVEPDDFVIGLRSFQHGISHSTVRGIVSPAYTVLRANSNLEPRFYKHYFRSTLLISQLANIAQGIRQGQAIDVDAFQNLPIPIPSLPEQRRIADFLDAETARIDRLLSLQSRQLSLLSAHHRSQLSETSDKLIKEYGAIRLRHLLTSMEQGWSPQCEDRLTEDNDWGVIKAGCVNSGEFDALQHKALPQGIEPRLEYTLKPGDLLMSRASGSPELIGSTGIVPDIRANLLLSDKVYRLTVDHTRAATSFIAQMLRSHTVREHIRNGISGADGMANNLPTPVVKDCVLPNVPLGKQGNIVAELMRDGEATARARSTLQRTTSLVAERRHALITAVVTGQIDVSTASGRGIEE